MVITTWVNVQSEVLAEYVSTRVTGVAEAGSIHISSASAISAAFEFLRAPVHPSQGYLYVVGLTI